MPFTNRTDAGRRLAGALADRDLEDPVVVGLPRGGVVVAAEVAEVLEAPLDVILVRKLGAPDQPELAMGAIGEGGVRVLDDRIAGRYDVAEIDAVEHRERIELERRRQTYRDDRPPFPMAGRTVVVVDDGLATGATAAAACRVVRSHRPRRVVLAVPVAPHGWAERMGDAADEYLAVEEPRGMWAIGRFYEDFRATSDDEVVARLARATGPGHSAVTGTIAYRERMALPPGAVATARLEDVSRADAPATVVGEHVVQPTGQVPIRFSIPYDPERIDERHTYAVRATITAGGRLLWTTDTHHPVLTRGHGDRVDLMLRRVPG